MLLYAIRLKGTNKYLPARLKRRGFSYDVPTEMRIGLPPRLHPTLRGAQNALTAWLQGEWVQETTYSGEWGDEADVEVYPKEPPIPRKREDMEIVIFTLNEVYERPRRAFEPCCSLEKRSIGGGCIMCGDPFL